MTLAQRILLSISALVILVTVTLTFAVRRAWESTAQEQFTADFSLATTRLREQLADEIAELPAQVQPLCRHSQMVDATLTELQAGTLDRERKYALSLLVPSTLEAYNFDELVLLTGEGEVLGAHRPALVGSTDKDLAERTRSDSAPVLNDRDGRWRIEAHCRKARGKQAVALYAARYLDSLFARVGALHGLRLSQHPPTDRPERFTRRLELPELRGVPLYASPRRMAVDQAVAQLNLQIAQWGALILVLALALGFWFARRLARPIVELSAQARQVVEGHPQPIVARGGAELREFADSFNRTLEDLVRLRERIAAVERIAAQREIARRVAHEIKNPLAPIRAAMETLRRLRARRDPAFEEYFEEATETVLGEVKRIATIVAEFTEFARLPAPSLAWFDFDAMLRSVVQLHQRDGITLQVNTRLPLQLRADRDQCVQVVTNLIQNAMDAARASVVPRVHVVAHATGNHIELRVEDNGPGIHADMRSRVFQAYVTTKREGTGLGLAIAQRIVIEHGGHIAVTDSALGGAAFVVTLPVDGPAVVLEANEL